MILIYLKEGECIEHLTAVSVGRRNGTLICYDRAGREVANYPALEVESFTSNPQLAELIIEEVCTELTTVAPFGVEPEHESEQR